VNLDGFGSSSNNRSSATINFNNQLYVGTYNTNLGAAVFRYDGGTSWTQINTDGFGLGNQNQAVYALANFDGNLFAGTRNQSNGGIVYRYDGGTSWTQINTMGFGDGASNQAVNNFQVFYGNLYATVTNTVLGLEIRRYDGGATWTQINTDGFGSAANGGGRLGVYKDTLYVSTLNSVTGFQVWRYQGGTSFIQIVSDGLGSINNQNPSNMVSYNGKMYIGTRDQWSVPWGAIIWEYDGSSWSQVSTKGFGDNNNRGSDGLTVYNGRLYAGTYNTVTGTELWESYVSSDLRVTSQAVSNPVKVSASDTITVTVTNSGPEDANDLTLTITLPAGSTYISASGTDWSCSETSGVITCTRDTLTASTSSTVTVEINAPGSDGSFNTGAEISWDGLEDDIENNVSSFDLIVYQDEEDNEPDDQNEEVLTVTGQNISTFILAASFSILPACILKRHKSYHRPISV